MGWNPQFNFKLRDDEVTFGNLIFDKRCVDLVSQALTKIKSGEIVDIEIIKQALDFGCYTDEEFTNMHQEFDEIKNDITYFKQLCSVNLIVNVDNWTKRIDANVGYMVGSNTWIEKYKELKLCAAELYTKLISKGFQFTPEETTKYTQRYGDILNTTDTKERLSSLLRKQYLEDRDSGVPNAEEIYIQAMIENGLISEEDADKKRALFGAVNRAVVNNEAVNNETVDAVLSDTEEIRADAVNAIINEQATHIVDMNTDKFVQIWNALVSSTDNNEKSIRDFGEYVIESCKLAGVDVGDPTVAPEKISLEDAKRSIDDMVAIMNFAVNRGLINSAGLTLDEKYYEAWTHPSKPADVESGMITLSTDVIASEWDEISNIPAASIRTICACNFYHAIEEILVKVLGNMSETSNIVNGVQDWASAQVAKEVTDAIDSVVIRLKLASNRPLVDRLGYQYPANKWNSLTEYIIE